MSGCSPSAAALGASFGPSRSASDDEQRLASRAVGEGLRQSEFSVPDIRCGGCIRTIEQALARLEGVVEARVNLTAKRVDVRWRDAGAPPPVAATLDALGYRAHLAASGQGREDRALPELVRALAVAGFASGNIMLLSVSVWSGADAAMRDLFHWISAVIALPVLVYSGRIFFRSAWSALRHGRTNMDVPISIGLLLAFGMSLYDTIDRGPHAYFDAVVMLVFFLLIGRTLDELMREKARSAVKGLAQLSPRGATVERADGTWAYLPLDEIAPGMILLIAAGERVPVDGRVVSGASDLDCALVTGESAPRAVTRGAELQAGTLNLTGPLRIEATATAESSFLAEMVRLMQAAEAGRSAYRRIADRVSQLYAPVVHSMALLSLVGWLIATGNPHEAVTIAVAVLIITCPCALGLAVPMVQVVAARRLFEQGIMVKDGVGLERLSEVDTVVFDKTGTLTLGRPRLRDRDRADPAHLALAAALAVHSRHPHSRGLVAAQGGCGGTVSTFDRVAEQHGYGVEASVGSDRYRLGRPDWALATSGEPPPYACTALAKNGRLLAAFAFDDPIRPGAREAVDALKRRGLTVEMLSGDHAGPVEAVAQDLGIARFRAGVLPGEKAGRLAALATEGRKVLMVGDGLNDAPALASAHVSMAPASAADVGRSAADFVFFRDGLEAVPLALQVSLRAGRLIRQNFALAFLYNAIALPFAVLGFVTPLVAALAMSASSIVVVANAVRLGHDRDWRHYRATEGGRAAVQRTPAPAAGA